MKLEVERHAAGRHHWRLVITAGELARSANGLNRRLRVVGGDVRVKLDCPTAPPAPPALRLTGA